jgi:gliding motility-associated-like protein
MLQKNALMRKLIGILFQTALFFTFFSASAQNLSNRGREFWVGYGHHQFFENGSNSQEMVLYLSTEQAANVTISINGTGYSTSFSIPANTVIATSPMPKTGTNDSRLYNTTNSEGIFNRGIHIVSSEPIVAYAHIYGSASSGATMLMPVNTWGYSYTSVNSRQAYGTDCFSWLYIVANHDNTKVRVTPAVPTRGGQAANVPVDIVLNTGQVYQMLGAIQSGSNGYEMTGSTVKSIANSAGQCYPVGVFSGSSRTWNPFSTCSPTGGGDNDIQQLFPSQAWGKKYLTAPTSVSSTAISFQTNMYKILVKDPTTVVQRNGVTLTGIIANTYYLFESNQPQYITADKPIMVAQFMSGGGCGGGGSNLGDPEMIYISPLEQGIKRVGFYRNNQQAISTNYLTLVIPTPGLSSLTIDGVGSSGFTYTYAHPQLAGYSVVVKRWTVSLPSAPAPGQCIVQSDSAFTAITYGLGSVESYGYNAGTMINNLNVIGSVHNSPDSSSATNAFTCRNTPAEISMLVAYKPTNMLWNLSQVPVLSPNADVNIANPVPVDSMLVNGTWYYRYRLPGLYTFSDTGSIAIPVTNTHPSIDNCNNSELVNFTISVKVSPSTNFTYTHTGCILDTVQFAAPVATGNGYNAAAWNWSFDDGTSLTGQNVSKLFNSSGNQNIHLKIVSAEGCIGDTIRSINVFPKPSVNFGTIPLAFCEGGTATFSDTSSYAGTAPINSWFWDFGTGAPVTVTTNANQTVNYPGYGTYTVKHLVKVSNTCISDTVIRTINVYAKPALAFSYPAGCLPSDGVVQFTSNTNVPDGQALNYSWNFGDANATSSNPNTSTIGSPTHTYTYGPYTIYYKVTTANGCFRDTSFSTTFNVRPLLAFSSLSSICASVNGTVSIAQGSVTNSVTGTGIYKGPGTDAQGNFSPSVAGAGTHTIWYVFTSAGGCTDSVSRSIKVFPKPSASFTVSADICADQTGTFTSQATISSGNINSWNWNFGDGNSVSNSNGSPFTRGYSSAGSFTVKLYTVSDSSCTSDTVTKTIAVHPLPVPNFTLPTAICLPNGSAVFANTSSVPDNSGMTSVFNFGDGSTASVTGNATHVYAAGGSYPVRLTVTSAFGCVKDTIKTLSAFFNKPIALFTVAPDTLCQGSNNNFTNNSTAPGSTIQSSSWNFGDGSTSSANAPVKKYNQAGNYSVSLTVTNAAGCISDPFLDTVIVYLQPVIDAGPSFVVLSGTQITFHPTVNDSINTSFLWTPASDFSDPTKLRPSIFATHNQVYTLTALGQGNCSASDTLSVKILKPITVPNAFSPNGDGINDRWEIRNLADYPGCTVEVYNRYGQLIFQSNGYGNAWDGRRNGTPMPFATYYYIITLKNGFAPVTGSITILK